MRLESAVPDLLGCLDSANDLITEETHWALVKIGGDVVVHSTTKYVGGHSDVLGGFVATNNDELAATLRFHQYAIGAVPGPLDCYLLLRGLKTLGVRMDRHCSNATAIAAFLSSHSAVERVYYPGLEAHRGHEVAVEQMSGFGGMVSFTLKGGAASARKVCESTQTFILAESLGGVESLIDDDAFVGRGVNLGTARQSHSSERGHRRLG